MPRTGFERKYLGGALTRFIHVLESYKKDYSASKHYGRVIAIVQSSASGKSRLVKELSNIVSISYAIYGLLSDVRLVYHLQSILSSVYASERMISLRLGGLQAMNRPRSSSSNIHEQDNIRYVYLSSYVE